MAGKLMRTAPRRRSRRNVALLGALIAALAVAVAITWALTRGEGQAVADGSEPPASEVQAASDPAAWGPLAVEDPGPAMMEAGLSGRLKVTEDCVFLVAVPATDILLVWPSDRTSWDDPSRAMSFTNADGSSVALRDGMSLRLSGGGFSEAEADISAEEWLDQRDWVSRPNDRCVVDEAWVVGNVLEAE